MLFKTESGIAFHAIPVQIGAKFNRSHAIVRDSHTGYYWERLPVLSYNEELVQRAVLKWPTHIPDEIELYL